MKKASYYSTPSKGIGGRIKQRISDFNVREITPEGKICEITLNEKNLSDSNELVVPENRDEYKYLIVVMEKFNLDINEAIRRIARFNHFSRKRISYAGIKDKRAISSQRISIYNPLPERMREFNSRFIRLREAEWSGKGIDLGELKGNEFEITIRDIELEEKEIERRVKECSKEMKKGIANYFGEQRFGGIRGITHLVGKEFVKGDFKKGVMLYLTESNEREEEEVRNARNNLKKSNDFSKAIKEFPNKVRYERAILNHLIKNEEDFIGAFRALPKKLRYLFVHAYQSHLFNEVINERISKGIGLKGVKGDVLIDGIPTAPLYGFESEFAGGKTGKIEKMVLEKEGIELKDFYVKKMKEMSSKGARKKIVLIPERLELLSVAKDEFNEGKLKAMLSFGLPKGDYATIVLRELMKAD
ncbi:MAG: tRNA pseudouridine(13) synthase TruD [archaeon]